MKQPGEGNASEPDPVATLLDGAPGSDILLVADHASNRVPPGIALGIAPDLLDTHIAIDIGSAALTRRLSALLAAPACLAGISRLVVDFNRDPAAPGVIPGESDGHAIAGNQALSDAERVERLNWHARYHRTIASLVRHARLVVSVHSFTPRLASLPDQPRPWPVGILHNRDDRAARLALAAFDRLGIAAGDNQPYSGKILNYTMDRHAEATGTPYLGLEVRQDEIADDAGVERWAERLAPIIREVQERLTDRT